jgi:predicted DNA-binding WGR domain protein
MALDRSVAFYLCREPTIHNKFWSIWLLQNGDLYVEYGRIGNAAQSKHHSIGNGTIAFRKMDSLIRQKQKKGYRQTESPQQITPEWSSLLQGQRQLHRSIAFIFAGISRAIAQMPHQIMPKTFQVGLGEFKCKLLVDCTFIDP